MSPSAMTVLAVAGAYLLACLAIGMRAGRGSSKSAAGFVAGDRTLGLLVMYFVTGATIFSAFVFLGLPGMVSTRGAAGYYIVAYGALGFVPFYFLGPRAARLGEAYGFVTQAEMLARRFDSRALAGVMALMSVVAFVPYLALQMSGAGHVLEAMSEGAIGREVGAALVYGIVAVYVWQSGVLGVGWTNTFQGLFMMSLAWFMGLYLPEHLHGGLGAMFDRIAEERPRLLEPPGLLSSGESWGWGAYSSAVLVSMVGFSFWPHLFMKAFTARSEETLRRTVVLYPTFALFVLPIVLLGYAGALYPDPPAAADQIVPHMLVNLDLAPLLVGLFCAGALAASMSSGDAMVHAAASIAVRDGLCTAGGRELAPERERTWIRVGVVLVLVASYVLAVTYSGDLVPLLLYAYGPVGQFAPVVVAGLYLARVPGAAVLTGLVAGSGVCVAGRVWPEAVPLGWHEGLWGLLLNTSIVTLWTLLRPHRPGPEEQRFLRIAAGRAEPVS